jgi:2-dehydro-3-deoxyphosphogluconate aldolase/(4S)-4-hydroxy-2-oxoglutarate aldolase
MIELDDRSFSMLTHCPVVPVIVLDDPAQALPLGEALLAGGITIAEITLRTSAGLEGIRLLSGQTELLVGAGSVLVADQVDQVVEAGAKFVVSPGL